MDSEKPPENQKLDLTSLETLFSSPAVAAAMRDVSESSFEVAAQFWRVPFAGKHLTPRMKELIFFAMHVSASALNVDAIRRQTKRILAAGGTREDIVDVLISIVALANHGVYSSVPVLNEEWAATGKPSECVPDDDPRLAAAKDRFIAVRGFWNPDRESIAREMPDYYAALTDVGTESWRRGPLTRKEREFICIAIDCNLTHSYPPGLRIHIKNALREGATKGEILEIFQLSALMGLEGYLLAAEAMFGI